MLTVVLAVVLSVALFGCVVVLIITERNAAVSRRLRNVPDAVAGDHALDAVGLGLRGLVASCEGARLPLPDVYAVVWSGRRLTLRLAGTSQQAPAPWVADEEGEEWSAVPGGGPAPAPAPGLTGHPFALTVTLGLAGSERILVSLSRASTGIALVGPDDDVRSLVRAMVAEVLTGPLGRSAQVVLVGREATEAITARLGVRSTRLLTTATLEEPITHGATAFAAASPSAPRGSSVTQVFGLIEGSGGRTLAGNPPPRLFVMDAAQFGSERAAAERLGRTDALLVLGDVPGTSWRFGVGAGGSLDTGALGVGIDTHAGRMR